MESMVMKAMPAQALRTVGIRCAGGCSLHEGRGAGMVRSAAAVMAWMLSNESANPSARE